MTETLSDRFSRDSSSDIEEETREAKNTVSGDSGHHYEAFKVDGLVLPEVNGRPGALFPFQKEGLDKALNGGSKFFFFGWATGLGKGIAACAGIQELLVNRQSVDVVLVFTTSKMKVNFAREINKKTQVEAKIVDGLKDRRRKEFEKADANVYVLNYEKANFDYELLEKRIKGKRVLFILDEVQKVLVATRGKLNKVATGLRSLIRSIKEPPYIWPMSATVINNNPERFWRLFDLPIGKNVLGTLTQFRNNYCSSMELVQRPWGGAEIEYNWSNKKLAKIPALIKDTSHFVRKSDPGVREYFKDIGFIAVPVQMSKEDRDLYEMIQDAGMEDDPANWGQYYQALKYVCNAASTLKESKSKVARILVESGLRLETSTSSKMEMLIDMISDIQDQGDKVVVFCQYTNMGLFQIAEELDRNKISYVIHYGTGMTPRQAQKAQDDFKKNSKITVFLSSDAGAQGLSFQEARYLINFDIPYSFDLLIQRNARIDRADSYLDGLTCYVLYNENTVEEKIFKINDSRRRMAEAIQGTNETISRRSSGSHSEENFLASVFSHSA